MLMVPDWILGKWDFLHHRSPLCVVLNLMLILSSTTLVYMCQEHPAFEFIIGGHWWFLTGYLEN